MPFLLALPAVAAHAGTPDAPVLRPDVPSCKTPAARLPDLGVNAAHDAPSQIRADFNGDGWCDFAYGVSYPVNSRMNAYDLSQLMVLGHARGWKPVFRGKKAYAVSKHGYDHALWPTFRIDLTDIRLLFPAHPGAPYVVGLFAGGEGEGTRTFDGGCRQYQSVHRWDDAAGTFRRANAATRAAVLDYFYTVMEKPCGARPSAALLSPSSQ